MCRWGIAGRAIQWKGYYMTKTKKRKTKRAEQGGEFALESRRMKHRQTMAENEEGGYATIDEIREGLFGFMPAIMRIRHFPDRATDDRKRQS